MQSRSVACSSEEAQSSSRVSDERHSSTARHEAHVVAGNIIGSLPNVDNDLPQRAALRHRVSPDQAPVRVADAVASMLRAEILDPETFAPTIDQLRGLIVADRQRGVSAEALKQSGPTNGSRPEGYVFSVDPYEQALQLYEALLSSGVYNSSVVRDLGFNLNLRWPEVTPFRERVIDRLNREDILVVLPFVAERKTAHKNVQYALDTVRDDAVIAVSAVDDVETETRVEHVIENTRATLVRQAEILRCFDWQSIGRSFGIPMDSSIDALPPAIGKGMTMLAGLAWAQHGKDLQNRMVLFSDTDFIDPWEYDSLAHLAIPLTIDDGFEPRLIKTAKTGAGRNNEAWTREANAVATDPRQHELTRGAALLCQQLVWPLSGNLAMHGADLYNMPFATGTGIETQMVVYYAGRQLESGRAEVAQVCNPNALTEEGESRPVRESALIGRCQTWLRLTLEACGQYEKLLHQWDASEIADFNRQHGGRHVWGSFQQQFHTAQAPSKIILDFMLPSLRQCDEIGAINWQRLESLKD